jgi:threonine dehydrogenase-like Zn-dependent dehydrogenase
MGAALFGYTKLYGQVPGGQAEYLRVPHADYGPIKVPEGPGDDRFLYLSDVLPTAWQAVEYAGVTAGDTLVVLGAGPIGDMASRIAVHRGIRTITVDLVAERLTRVAGAGAEAVDLDGVGKRDLGDHLREMTGGRGPDAVVDAVGMEAHGSPGMKALHKLVGLLPDAVAEPMMNTAGTDRMAALYSAFDIVRRGGTISLSGVYGGMADPIPMLTLFDKQVQLRMGQANVKRWVPDILPLLEDEDPLGVDSFATHHLPLDEAPTAYQMFQEKKDGAVKVVFRP